MERIVIYVRTVKPNMEKWLRRDLTDNYRLIDAQLGFRTSLCIFLEH